MIKYLLTWYFTLFALFSIHLAQAQELSTRGKEFCFSFISNAYVGGSGGSRLIVNISARTAVTGTIYVGGIPLQNFAVAPNAVFSTDIPNAIGENRTSETVQNMGIRIVASDSVSVHAGNMIPFRSDASLVFPVHTLGTEYRVISYHPVFASEVIVTPVKDNTEVEIIPTKATMGGRPAGVPFKIMLHAGQNYQVMANQDLTGTVVRSTDPCKPIAVFSGNQCTNVPTNVGACDHLYEQMFPIKSWGKEYYSAPLLERLKGDLFRAYALENNTLVTINGGAPKVVNKDKHMEWISEFPQVIKANKPIAVAQYSVGGTYDNVTNADPFLLMLLPGEQFINNITFSTINGNTVNHHTNIVTATGNVPSMKLNGVSIAPRFKPFASAPELSYAQLSLDLNSSVATSHTLTGTGGFNAYCYGFGYYDSYGYAAGGDLKNISVRIQYPKPVCIGRNISFEAVFQNSSVIDSMSWKLSDGTTGTGNPFMHNFSVAGDYTLKLYLYTNGGQCPGGSKLDSIVTQIHVTNGQSLLAEAGDDLEICEGDTAALNGSGGSLYSWAPDSFMSGNTSPNPRVWPTRSTMYYLTVMDSVCAGTGIDSVMVSIQPKPKAAFIWEKDSLTVRFNGDSSHGIYSWYWDFGDRSTPSDERNPSHTYVQKDKFWITLIVESRCGKDTIKYLLDMTQDGKGSGSVGIGSMDGHEAHWKVWPNPFAHELHFSWHISGQPLEWKLFTPDGRIVASGLPEPTGETGSQQEYSISIDEHIKNGGTMYLLVVHEGGTVVKPLQRKLSNVSLE